MIARHIPNALTVARMLLAWPIVWALAREQYGLTLALFAVAGFSDGVDGFLARRYGWHSRLGSILDPLSDKVLLVAAFLSLGYLGHLPVWLVVAVLGRDVIIVTGALVYHAFFEPVTMEPTLISKLNTVCQIVLVLATVMSLGFVNVAPLIMDALVVLVGVTTISSGVAYVWIWTRRAQSVARKRGAGD